MNRLHVASVEVSIKTRRAFAAPAWIRRVLRALRRLPDRLLHHRRHLAARDRISRMNRPRNVLVVCHGNVCRSPYLEAVLQRTMSDVRVQSAGFVGPGRAVPAFALSVSAQRGLDLSAFRSRPLVPAVARDADLILVMDAHQARHVERAFGVPRDRVVVVGDLDPTSAATRAIADPWEQPIEAFVSSYDRLDRCAETLVGSLPSGPGSSQAVTQ